MGIEEDQVLSTIGGKLCSLVYSFLHSKKVYCVSVLGIGDKKEQIYMVSVTCKLAGETKT